MTSEFDFEVPLRLAFSYREKALRALSEVEVASLNGAIPESEFQERQRRYREEQAAASGALERIRKQIQAAAESLRAKLRAARHEQAHLPERVQSGRLSPARANDRNRELAAQIDTYRNVLRQFEAWSMAETADDVGGFLDLSFEEYRRRFASLQLVREDAAPTPSIVYPKRWELLAVCAGAGVCILAVFFPWVVRDAESESLLRVGFALSPDGASSFARMAWIAYVLAPVAAVVLLLRSRGSALGWSVLGIGLAMLAGALIPVVLFGADRVHNEDWRQLVAALHVGPVLYAAGALIPVVVGALRVSPWSDSLAHSMATSLALAGTVIAIAATVAMILFFGPEPGSVTFDVTRYEGSSDLVRVICRNQSRDAIQLAVPWPDTDAEIASGAWSNADYGARLEVREKESDTFRALPYSQDPWSLPESPSLELPVVDVRSQAQVELALDLRQFTVVGADPETVLLTFTRRGGRPVARYEIPLPSRYLSPAAEARNPLHVPPPETSAPIAHAVPESSTDIESEQEPVVRLVSRGGFTLTGIVGGKAAVETWDGNGLSTGTRLLGAGELIGEGWYLESISDSPAAIVAHHDPTGTEAVVTRGDRMSFGVEEVTTTP